MISLFDGTLVFFVHRNGFFRLLLLIEIIAGAFVFLSKTKRRDFFVRRLLISGAIAIVLSCLHPMFRFQNPVASTAMGTFWYLVLVGEAIGVLLTCFDVSWEVATFAAFASYAVQHLCSEIDNIINGLIDTALGGDKMTMYTQLPAILVVFSIGLLFVWLACKRIMNEGDLKIKSKRAFILIAAVVLVDIFLSSYRGRAFSVENYSPLWFVINAFSILASGLIVVVLFGLIEESALKTELQTIDRLFKEESKQFEISKETIDSINIKCHDLKYRLRAARKEGDLNPDLIKDIERDMNFYDATVKTGNDAVDVLLNEKSYFCKNKGITFTHMIDGQRLKFMDIYDLYSLLGNATSNCIEAVMNIENKDKRVINVIVKEQFGMVSIHMENYFKNIEKNANNELDTTKDDKANHGFGIKSMKRIVEKYEGSITLTQEEDLFITDIIIPIKS